MRYNRRTARPKSAGLARAKTLFKDARCSLQGLLTVAARPRAKEAGFRWIEALAMRLYGTLLQVRPVDIYRDHALELGARLEGASRA